MIQPRTKSKPTSMSRSDESVAPSTASLMPTVPE
jgi:hypothetical protein